MNKIAQALYVMRIAGEFTNFVKIGVSHNPIGRAVDLGRARKVKLEVLYASRLSPHCITVERAIHKALKAWNIHTRLNGKQDREWFAIPADFAVSMCQEMLDQILGMKEPIKKQVSVHSSLLYEASKQERAVKRFLDRELRKFINVRDLYVRAPPPTPTRWPSAVRDCLNNQENENG